MVEIKRNPAVDKWLNDNTIRLTWENGKLESPDLNDELLAVLDEEWGDEKDRYYD
jgi:hypothetical protein